MAQGTPRGTWQGILGLLLGACASPTLDGMRFACQSDAECASGEICADLAGVQACQAISDSPIRIGMSGPLLGPSRDLGIEMRRGIQAMLDRVNDPAGAGGVHGRQVELLSFNDNYDPELAVERTLELLDVQELVEDMDQPDIRGTDGVFALVGNVGTPTALATAPLATKNGVVFFGPFTGAQEYLRDDTNSPYVYNYRAGYADETAAMVEYLSNARIPAVIANPATDYRRILVFAQNDSFGDAGYDGLITAYNQDVAPLPAANAIARVGYTREDVESVDPAVVEAQDFLTDLLARGTREREPVAIVMIDTYLPGNRFIRRLKNWVNEEPERASRLDLVFMHVSFVGSDSLAEALTATPEDYPDIANPGQTRTYAEGVMVTQVVPYYMSQEPGIVQYREDIRSFDGGRFTFTSLEGYVVARLFTRALELNGPHLTTENFLRTLDTEVRQLDIGIGPRLSFSPSDHQASDTVWGTQILETGDFEVPFVWNRADGIIFNASNTGVGR